MRAEFDLLSATLEPVLAQDFGYEYDPIGNRKTTSHLCGLASLRENYIANNLNQYVQRTVPGKFSVLGSASEDAFVTVSLTNGTPSPADWQGKYWHKARDERGNGKTLPGQVRLGVRVEVVWTDEVRDATVLFQHAQRRADSNCAVRKSLQ